MIRIHALSHSNSRSGGFTLLEVLVALLVLSLGLLGLAALQTVGIKFNQQSYQRTQATFYAYDILDRMRANRTAAGTVNPIYSNITTTTYPGSTDCAATACTADQMAEYDIRKWKDAIAATLNQGVGQARVVSGRTREVIVGWVENDVPISLAVQADL